MNDASTVISIVSGVDCRRLNIGSDMPCCRRVFKPMIRELLYPSFQVLIVDSLGYIKGSGAIVHPNVIVTSAQFFEG